jgi:type II secretory pathway predicted ATPase ExeA
MTTRIDRSTIDVANPPEGVMLQIGGIAAQLRCSVSDMADATGLGRSTVWNICARNRWPVGRDATQLRDLLIALLRERGASDEQLQRLFHAHLPPLGRPPLDGLPSARATRATKTTPIDDDEGDTDVLLPKQSLTLAARKAFNLHFGVSPFDGEVTDDAQMFNSDEIRYVREACLQAATAGSFVAVVGESGAGKTTIQADLESRIERDRKPVIVIKPSVLGMEDTDTKGKTLKSSDILAAVITRLSPLSTVPQTIEARSRKAERMLRESAEAGFAHLVLIEEAHCMPDATLKHLKRLHELKLGRRPLLGILLLAQPELLIKLDPKRAHMREVTQRCEIVQLLPLDGDLKPYLAHRAAAVARELKDFIDDSGIEALRAKLTVTRNSAAGKTRVTSLAYPLAVNNLMTAALNTAAEIGAPVVTRDVVNAV